MLRTIWRDWPLRIALGGAILLGACQPLNIQQIQQFTVQICGFLPTAVQIANLFPNPVTVPAEVVAQAICAAVTAQVPPSTRRRLRAAQANTSVTVTVNGQSYVVSGYFVR